MASWLAFTAATILVISTGGFPQAPSNGSPGDIRVSGNANSPPHIVFACDGSTSELESLFSQPGVISDLKALDAGIALALPDLSTAWLALPGEQGYYLNAGNAPEAAAHFTAFQTWTSAYGLQWAGVGLDIEPNIQEFGALRSSKWRLAWTLFRRYFDMERIRRAKESYSSLIREIQSQGYPVETYQFPFLADARRVHSTLLERLAGIVDFKGNREVLMIFTSFNYRLASALIWVYGPDAQAIAIGSTSGPDAAPRFTPLHWEEFSRDLIVASHFSREIGVYNLRGSVQQGFLPRLKTLNWNQSVDIPAESIRKATQFRARIQRALWLGSHLPYFAVAALIAITWILAHRSRRRRLQRLSATR
jgi:hypothetical protein